MAGDSTIDTTRSPVSDPELDGGVISDDGSVISDAELTTLALADDPDLPLDPDAVPLSAYLSQVPALLPDWYMAPAMARSGNRWRALVVLTIISAFILIEALGLCSTYGQLRLG